MDASTLTEGIRLALAPVFLLTGIASLIGAVGMRLARIIDRARLIEDRLETGAVRHEGDAYRELNRLRIRGRLVNFSMMMLAACAVLVALTIVTLFLGETTQLRALRWVSVSFVIGIGCFVLALLAFLVETLLATHTLRFRTGPGTHNGRSAE